MNKGILYILIASLFFSIINALVKYFAHIPAIEIVFFRSVVSLVISYYSIRSLKIKIFNEHTPLLLGRGISGAIALSLYFYTIQHMPLATAVTILYLAPIFTIILAIVLVKEYPNKWQWPFFILSFIGAALMKNIDPRASLFHFSMGVTAAFFAGLAYTFIRLLKDKAHHSLVIFYFPLVTIPFCLPFLSSNWVSPTPLELVGLLSIGIFTQIAQVFMTKAYMAEQASKISHFNYLTCFYAFATGIIFFDEHLSPLSIFGLCLVFVGIIFSTKFSSK
ncbi:MAG: drug/metabolite transporter (DMT)-like permease [Bacteriovoracaceae bacterium]|jgi:drug/metabolite transporter (DMT)-like permease